MDINIKSTRLPIPQKPTVQNFSSPAKNTQYLISTATSLSTTHHRVRYSLSGLMRSTWTAGLYRAVLRGRACLWRGFVWWRQVFRSKKSHKPLQVKWGRVNNASTADNKQRTACGPGSRFAENIFKRWPCEEPKQHLSLFVIMMR